METNFQLIYRKYKTEQEIQDQIPYERYLFLDMLESQLQKEKEELEKEKAGNAV